MRELLRTARPLRRQRRAHFGFDLCDIRRVDQAIRIHVFAKIRATDRYAHLRLGHADIGGIDGGIAIHIAYQHAHGSGNVTRADAIVHVKERNSDSLDVDHASEIDGDLRRPAPAETAHAPGPRGHCCAADRDRACEVNNHLIIVCGPAAAGFDPDIASEWQVDVERAGCSVRLSRDYAGRRDGIRIVQHRAVKAGSPKLPRRSGKNTAQRILARQRGVVPRRARVVCVIEASASSD
jgi:hypothetical protein